MNVQHLSYLGNAIEALVLLGVLFMSGKKGYREAVVGQLQALVEAQRLRIELLTTQNSLLTTQNQTQETLIASLRERQAYLEELLLGANPKVVDPGYIPRPQGSGSGNGSAAARPANNG